MNDSERLAKQLDMALHGEAWHGPSWQEILKDLEPVAASRRPIPEAHSIAEIVVHAGTWNEIVRQRLQGLSPSVPDHDGWLDIQEMDKKTWDAAVKALFDHGVALRETVAKFPPERLHENRSNTDGTWQDLILGQLQHLLYHAGQAAVLKKGAIVGSLRD
jgi:hypothetical protein